MISISGVTTDAITMAEMPAGFGTTEIDGSAIATQSITEIVENTSATEVAMVGATIIGEDSAMMIIHPLADEKTTSIDVIARRRNGTTMTDTAATETTIAPAIVGTIHQRNEMSAAHHPSPVNRKITTAIQAKHHIPAALAHRPRPAISQLHHAPSRQMIFWPATNVVWMKKFSSCKRWESKFRMWLQIHCHFRSPSHWWRQW